MTWEQVQAAPGFGAQVDAILEQIEREGAPKADNPAAYREHVRWLREHLGQCTLTADEEAGTVTIHWLPGWRYVVTMASLLAGATVDVVRIERLT